VVFIEIFVYLHKQNLKDMGLLNDFLIWATFCSGVLLFGIVMEKLDNYGNRKK